MEITYSRTCHYSRVLDEADLKSLRKSLGLRPTAFTKLVEEDCLLEDHWDGVMAWLNSRTEEPDLTDQDEIDDIEVHA